MKAIHFMKTDYILTRKQIYMVPVFYALAVFVGMSTGSGEASFLIASTYMMFIATIFSTAPFGNCTGKYQAFLLLLPATVKERVIGRFLYGLSYVGVLALFCGLFLIGYRLRGYEMSPLTMPALLCVVAVSIALTAVEFLFFYVLGEGKGNWQYLSNIVRVAPGMGMFFAGSYFLGELRDSDVWSTGTDLETLVGKLTQTGVTAVAAALLLTAVAAAVCVKVVERRDYA